MAPLSRRRQVGRLLLPVETEPPGSRIPDLPVRVFTTVQQVGFRSGGAGFGQSQERLPPHQGLPTVHGLVGDSTSWLLMVRSGDMGWRYRNPRSGIL